MLKHINLLLAVFAAICTVLMLIGWIWHEKDHDHSDYAPMLGLIAFTILSFILMGVATVRNWKDANRSRSLEINLINEKFEHNIKINSLGKEYKRELGQLNSYGNGLVEKIKIWQEQAEHWEKKFLAKQNQLVECCDAKNAGVVREKALTNNIEILKLKHEADLKDARRLVIHSATWGLGGQYSEDVTNKMNIALGAALSGAIIIANDEMFGAGIHPGGGKELRVIFQCPCSSRSEKMVFEYGSIVDLNAHCISSALLASQ